MKYRQLGRTGLRVSQVILGCGNFGGIGSAPAFFGKGEDRRAAFALMDRAWELGINCFDTADAYGGGASEAMIGEWLASKGPEVQGGLLIATKVFNRVGPGPNDWGLSRRHIQRQVEASLRRLGREAIDLYLVHEPDPTTPIDETLRALDDLVRAGKLRYLGASNFPAWRVCQALWRSDRHALHRFEFVQNSFSLFDRGDERELLPLCEAEQLGYTPFSPLAGGWLTGVYGRGRAYPSGSRMTMRPEPYRRLECPLVDRSLDRLDALAAARGCSMAALALAWLLHHPRVTAPIVGPTAPDHLAPICEALELDLSADELRTLADEVVAP
jgi:aryl-alcohol dehydrogenase-like predicted oxidoreductase